MTEKRDAFKSRWGFILACIGSAVGMGNIWRFPYLVSEYGGLTFILPYLFFVILIGSTGIIEEFALGRAAGTGPVGAFGMCTELRTGKKTPGKIIGAIPIIGALGLSIGYTVVFAWIIKYTVMAVDGKMYAMGGDMDTIGGTFGQTASAGGANTWIVVAALAALLIMAFGIANGIEKANKVMMPVLFFLFVALGIYVATRNGASEGYKYILRFNKTEHSFGEVLLYAFGQAFFSLSVAGNGSVIYGSYLSKKEDLVSSARNVAIFDTLAALLASFVIIPAMAASGADLTGGGPGLMFIYLVNVLNGMAGGRIIGVIFFIAVLFAGLSSIINLYEAPTELLQTAFGKRKWNRPVSTAIVIGFGCVMAILIQAITSDWMDYVSIFICPLGALLAAIMYFWVAGKEFALREANVGAKKPVGSWFYVLGKYVFCALALLALVAGAINFASGNGGIG